jgi:hypothetical protein|tara:strand:+ start:161 stop:601 length:441 start_codon:yes stop_codon:yes gene_type:complete
MSEEDKPYDEVTTGQEKPVKKGIIQEIQDMKESGEINTAAYKEKIRELEVILGVKHLSPFGTNELEIFEDNLKSMNLTDMMRIAQKAGLNPHQERPRLKASLLKEFKAYTRNNRRNAIPNPVKQKELDPNNPVHAETIKILQDLGI